MTFEELNVIRNLKKRLSDEEQKLEALKLSVESIVPQFSRNKDGFTCLDDLPKAKIRDSRTEKMVLMIIDAERRIASTHSRIDEEIAALTEKIQREVVSETDQALLIHRYVNCKNFREIGILLGFSEAHTYFTHRRILKNLLQENLIVNNSR